MPDRFQPLCENQWLSLRVIREPDRGINGYVYSHETRCHGLIIAVLPYRWRTDGTVEYLLRRECTPCWSLGQELSAITGGCEGGDPAADAVRELAEETGYAVSRDKLIALGESHASKSSDTVYSLYTADLTGLQPGEAVGDGSRLEAEGGTEWLTDKQLAGVRDPQVSVMALRMSPWVHFPQRYVVGANLPGYQETDDA